MPLRYVNPVGAPLVAILATIAATWLSPVGAEPLTARAAVEASEVFVGQAFQFQIQVSGSESPDPPDLSGLKDFDIQAQGGRSNSSHSVTIVNGRMTQVVKRGYIFVYRLTPTRAGRLIIPAVTVRAEGSTTRTQAVAITAKKPAETEDYKLRMGLSSTECYVGEPVILAVTWYIGQDVRGFDFNVPLLREPSLIFADPPIGDGASGELYRIPLGDAEVIGRKARGRLEGREYATLSFRRVLIPQRAGALEIAPATVTCEGLIGYRQARRRSLLGDSFFDSFFNDDFFGRGDRGVYQKVVVPSNPLVLRVSELPLAGRPANFAGHVGPYRIESSATPTKVKVGDPITLIVTLRGPGYLERVELSPLNAQVALTADFRVPAERAAGESHNGNRVFTQTIRALRPDVQEIPPIELPYFDTRDGKYRIARSEPIPLEVSAVRIVTAADAEGLTPTPVGSAIEVWSEGIAHNYEDLSCLEDQQYGPMVWLRSTAWSAFLGGLPIAFLIALVGSTIARRRQTESPLALRRRGAYKRATQAIEAASKQPAHQSCEACLKATCDYLGDQLGLTSRALTYNDVRDPLRDRGIDDETLASLGSLFDLCEAGRYAGDSSAADAGPLAGRDTDILRSLELNLN